MAKKIYDIKPPKLSNKTETIVREIPVESKRKKRPSKHNKQERSIWVPIISASGVLVLLLAVYLFFKLPKADVQIWPKVETLTFQQTITADKSVDSIDTAKAVIPAKYFEATKTDSQDFPATGNASDVGMATGTITIYNKYDPPTPLNFKAGTHFMSDSGKLFIAFQKVSIPAAQKSGSKITPGSVQINVQAVEGGDSYNIPPSNFSVPGLKGTSYYYSIYATSASAMTGGYTGKVKKVTSDDILSAKDVLSKKATSEATDALKSQISSEYVLLDNAIFSNVTDASTATKAGAVAESFNYQATAKASALAFKKSDLDQFARNYLISQMPEGKTLLENSFNVNYSASVIDVSGGKATINLDFSSGIYQNVDRNSLTLSLIGQNENQIKDTIDNTLGDQVSAVKINFWPFWVSRAPNNQKSVDVKLKFQ